MLATFFPLAMASLACARQTAGRCDEHGQRSQADTKHDPFSPFHSV